MSESLQKLHKPKPRVSASMRTYWYRESNGSLLCQTKGFPDSIDPAKHSYHNVYSDRLFMHDQDRFAACVDLLGRGEQGWGYVLPSLSEEALRKFAQVAFGLGSPPLHVRAIYWFNVSSGYDRPSIEAITLKQEEVPA